MRMTLIVGGIAGLLLAGTAQAAPGGSFQQSCRNVRDVGRSGISAQCRDQSGRFRDTRLDLSTCDNGDIGNDNGRLVCAAGSGRPGSGGSNGWGGGRPGQGNGPGGGWDGGSRPGSGSGEGRLPGGSWRESCRGGEVRGGTLSAVCESAKGRKRESSIPLSTCRTERFGNDNGRLTCE